MKKLISVTVILLSIGLAFAPSIFGKLHQESINESWTIYLENEHCGCNDSNEVSFSIFCSFLKFLFELVLIFSPYPVPLMCHIIIMMAEKFDCPNIP